MRSFDGWGARRKGRGVGKGALLSLEPELWFALYEYLKCHLLSISGPRDEILKVMHAYMIGKYHLPNMSRHQISKNNIPIEIGF